jgi:sugar phosphate isomerase/epimerase
MTDYADGASVDRRGFLKTAGAGLAAASAALTAREAVAAQVLDEKHKLDRIATNSWALRQLFKTRGGAGRGGGAAAGGAAGSGAPAAGARGAAAGRGGGTGRAGTGGVTAAELKKKYGEITMMDFPQFTKDTFPGVTHLDIRSSLIGDVTDSSMYGADGYFDPSTASGRKWLEAFARKLAATGTRVQHISNNAPTNLADSDVTLRKAGVEIGKKWLDGAAIIGVRSVRMNSPSAFGPSIRPQAVRDPATGYPKNDALLPYLNNAIESYKEMADHGGNLGIRVTIENHWGLAADPVNIRIILDAVNHPYCEATPDFCNWEHEHMLFSGLKVLAPYAHTNCHAKYWDRWTTNDVQRSVRIMLAAGYKGTFALEYEDGPWDGVEGSRYLFKEVLAALSSPAPVI